MKSNYKDYQPINCSYYDQLLHFATLKQKVLIRYNSLDNQQHSKEAIIQDIFTKSRAEFMQLDTGDTIRLDYLISVNDHLLPPNSSCKHQD